MNALTLVSLKAWAYKDSPLMGLTYKIFYGFKALINPFHKFLFSYGKNKHRLLI